MSLLRRIRRNKAKTTLARGGHRCTIGYAKRALDGMTWGLHALSGNAWFLRDFHARARQIVEPFGIDYDELWAEAKAASGVQGGDDTVRCPETPVAPGEAAE
jgi:hypothetical protein